MAAVLGTLIVNLLMFLRFFFPRALYEPKTKFTIGYPVGFRVRRGHQIPEGPPNLGGPQHRGNFRHHCHLHSSGLHARLETQRKQIQVPVPRQRLRSEGINFEGPAPRPMDRAHVELDPQGQIVVDVSHSYSWPKGERSQFGDHGAILRNV